MRKRKCKVCRTPFTPTMPLQAVCFSHECAVAHGRVVREKAQRKATRKRREALMTVNDHHKLVQREFNAYIRLRDATLPCVSCGRYHQGQYHAGHYRPVGGMAGAALRYNEINCHKQCSACNNHKSGALTDYRIELIRRIGIELVEWLERDFPAPKWTIEELKALRKYYKDARRAMMTTPGECEPF